jgi:hypothetical protein
MIVQLKGKVKFPITLDVGSWIFDKRKMEMEKAFQPTEIIDENPEEEIKKASMNWDKELTKIQLNADIDSSIRRAEKEKILSTTYVMNITPFVQNAEPTEDAKYALLKTNQGDEKISLEQLTSGFFQFSQDGKALKDDGPLYFYFGDGSNKDTPIKGIYEIIID